MKIRTLLVLLALSLASCHRDGPSQGQFDQKKFAALYADLLEISMKARRVGSDSTSAARQADSVLATAGVTRGQFEAAMRWYNDDVRRWKPFLDEVVRNLEERTRPNSRSS